jgi:hypothetical protein
MPARHTFSVRIKLPSGGFEEVEVTAENVHKARDIAESQTGGTAVGSHQID